MRDYAIEMLADQEAEVRMPGAAEGADACLVRLLQDRDHVGMICHVFDVGHPQDWPQE